MSESKAIEAAREFCSSGSLSAGESLLGTAPHVDTWLLLEYTGTWGKKALEESDLAEGVKGYLKGFLDSHPRARLNFIRNRLPMERKVRFYKMRAAQEGFHQAEYELTSYEDLLDIDFEATAKTDQKDNEAMFLVCTNGRRDACCAKYGVDAYNSLAESFNAWECTHVGQHRFAANMICFPYGIYYGRVRAETSANIAESHLRGEIVLENLRGRGTLPQPAQAAEGLLRSELGDYTLGNLRLQELHELQKDRWRAMIAETATKEVYEVIVAREWRGVSIAAACEGEKPVELSDYVLVGHRVIDES